MWPKFGAGLEAGWMSVVRSGDRVDLAHVIRSAGRRPEIRLCDSFRIEQDEADALRRLGGSRGLKRHRCAALLNESQYRLIQLDAPAVPVEEQAQAVRWRLKDMVDFPVDDAAVALADIPAAGARQPQVFAVAASSAVVGERMALFHAAGVPLAAIDVPEMAVRNVAVLFEETNRGLAFLVLTRSEGLLTITFRGELFLARRIDVSAGALAEADPARRTQLLERLGLELQRTFDNFDRQYGGVSLSCLRLASEFDPAGTVAALADSLYLPVRAANLAEVLEFDRVPGLRATDRQAQGLLAVGAALRSAP